MVTTNDKSLWSSMWSYKDHGKSYDAVYNRGTQTRVLDGCMSHLVPTGACWKCEAVIGRIQLRKNE